MAIIIDGSLYPDEPAPEELLTVGDKIDYLARLCSAWDFGILPEWETVEELRKDEWKEVIEVCNLLTSPTYHLLREWQHLPKKPFLGSIPAYILEDPNLEFV
ncbi:MAG: hypothetical protein WCG34_13360 [Leptolinea sp.]